MVRRAGDRVTVAAETATKFGPKLALQMAASLGINCVGEAGPALRETARGRGLNAFGTPRPTRAF